MDSFKVQRANQEWHARMDKMDKEIIPKKIRFAEYVDIQGKEDEKVPTKSWDGKIPLHKTFAILIKAYYNKGMKTSSDVLDHVPVNDLHRLSGTYLLLSEVIKKCKEEPEGSEKIIYFFPKGDTESLPCNKAHYNTLRILREIIRKTHNYLHDGAVKADKLGLKDRQASDYVLNYVREEDAKERKLIAEKRLMQARERQEQMEREYKERQEQMEREYKERQEQMEREYKERQEKMEREARERKERGKAIKREKRRIRKAKLKRSKRGG